MICSPSFLPSGEREGQYTAFGTYDARTTSRPHGEIDIEPTGCLMWKERSWPNVSLLNAEMGPLEYMAPR